MRRYSAETLERNPEKRGRDLETTRRACERFATIPVTILNFAVRIAEIEGEPGRR